jgi:hypothetical protein
MAGRLGVRRYCHAECDGGEQGHGLACNGLLLDVLYEMHEIAFTVLCVLTKWVIWRPVPGNACAILLQFAQACEHPRRRDAPG